MMTEMKPLKPLDSGIVLIVGTKASNFDNELRNHPRIVMWDSQQEHWTDKEMPTNTRAVFMTRFMGHSAFTKIVTEARKKNITIFNPTGTGIIVKQVKELLAIPTAPTMILKDNGRSMNVTKKEETTMGKPLNAIGPKSTMHVFIPHIDFNLTNAENARRLLPKAAELGITTTIDSLNQFVWAQRRKLGIAPVKVRKQSTRKIVTRAQITRVASERKAEKDVTVEILDSLIQGLTDIRQYLVDTVEENRVLRARVEKFKIAMEGL